MFFKKPDRSDEELMQLVQRGDREAMTTLYRRYAQPMLRYFYRMLWRDAAIAQDFLHDLFVKIIDRPEYYDANHRFSTWLYSVANNMCKNEYRKQALRKTKPHANTRELHQDGHVIVMEQDFQSALDALLDTMDEDDRHLFVLRHELELPVSEIATMLNCPEGTVKSKLFYLKKKMATHLLMFQPEHKAYGKI